VGLLCAGLGLALAGAGIARRIDPKRRSLGGSSTKPASVPLATPLIELGLAIGATAIFLHSIVDFDLHEAPTALTAFLLLGLLLGPAGDSAAGTPRGASRAEPSRPRLVAPWLRLPLAFALGLAIALALAAARSDRAYRRAYQVLSRGDLAGSERWLARALEYVPDEARVWIARGEVARHRARLATDPGAKTTAMATAVAHFRRAAAAEPEIAARWQRLALVLAEGLPAGVPVDAAELAAAVNRAQALNPVDPLNRELLAPLARLTAVEDGAGQAAGREAAALLRQLAAGKGWASGLAARHLGDLALAQGRAAEANSWYDRASSVGDSVEARAGTEGK